MSSGLRMRLAKIEAAQSPPTLWGDFVHENGRPTRHQFWSESLDVARWFATGELPKNVAVFVTCQTEAELRHIPDDLSTYPHNYAADHAESLALWKPFPALHPDALKTLERIIVYTKTSEFLYNFDGYAFRGVGGVLSPQEQVRELMPHG